MEKVKVKTNIPLLEKLNPEQKKAVTYKEGPLLIVAGAGTGKTMVITKRIAYLIYKGLAKPEEILALTFTDKAAEEMEERVDILLPYGVIDTEISTFHSFGDKVLNENGLELGLSPDLKVLSQPEQVIFFREHLFNFPLSYYRPVGNPTRYIQAMLNLISRAKDEDVSPDEYINYAKYLEKKAKANPEDKILAEEAKKQMEIGLTYQKYQQLLRKEDKMDFGDQLSLTLKLFRQRPTVLNKYQNKYKYILVDEFQDTNHAQFEIVKLLAQKHRNITVTGDDDQCLPPGTPVATPEGEKNIEDFKEQDEVITAIGKGYTGVSKVTKIFKNVKKSRFLTFTTERSFKVKVTDNHKMFCFVPPVSKVGSKIGNITFSLVSANPQHRPALIMPAKNVLIGHYLPVYTKKGIVYDKVIDIKENFAKETVHDLEIERTHNFIAKGVVVHNSIYKFRGAALSNIMSFVDTYPEAEKVVLTKNYRSTQDILDRATQLIRYNNPDRLEVKENIDKNLEAIHKHGKKVSHLHFDTLSDGSDSIAKMIKHKVDKKEYTYKDFAILVRANNQADPYLRSLNMLSIPWRFTGNQGLYNRNEVRLLICFLKVISNLHDSVSLYHLSASQVYQINIQDLTLCLNYANRNNRSLYYVFLHLPELTQVYDQVHDESKEVINKIIQDINKFIQMSINHPTGQVLYKFIVDTGYLKKLVHEESETNEEKIQNIANFFKIVNSASSTLTHDRVPQFAEHLDMLIEAGDNPAVAQAELDVNAVNVLTVHKAKGLEFPVVIMVDLVKDRFPTRRRREPIMLPEDLLGQKEKWLPQGDPHLQEERRLFFVGMTRAKKELYLCSARDYGGKTLKKVSRFVLEALDIAKQDISAPKTSALEVIQRSAPAFDSEESIYKEIPQDEVVTVSHLQIDDYDTCPLKYKYIHILRVPLMQHHAVVYGKCIHEAVQEYYRRKMNQEEVTINDIVSYFEQVWSSEGFMSREHEKQMLEEGRKVLGKFYKQAEKEEKLPTYIEEEFKFMLGNNRVIGRWDRVDVIDGEVRIIDFKSSDVKHKEKADKKAERSLQLSIYALGYEKKFGTLPDYVQLNFLGSGIIGSAKVDSKRIDKVKEKILEVTEGIRKRDYKAKPNVYSCSFCAFQYICPYTLQTV